MQLTRLGRLYKQEKAKAAGEQTRGGKPGLRESHVG